MEKSEEEKRRDEKISDKFFICLNCFYQVPKIDFIYENNKKKLLYFCSCGEQYSNSLSSYITSLSKLKLNYSINAKCFSTLHPEANSSFYFLNGTLGSGSGVSGNPLYITAIYAYTHDFAHL